MIFATIGTQAPFDRFIKILDEIAPMSNELIIAQTYKGRYQPKILKRLIFWHLMNLINYVMMLV